MIEGPASWENARHARLGTAASERWEAMLYGEAELRGHCLTATDPYRVMSVGPVAHRVPPRAIAVVRAEHHRPLPEYDVHNMATRLDSFHGGDDNDEIAAVLSLALRIRCRSGGIVRHWFRNTPLDGPGQPFEADHSPPSLQLRGAHQPTMLPHLRDIADLPDLEPLLASFLSCESSSRSAAIVKSARLYQQAVWIADEDPNLAFLWLVSSIEVAAGFHRQSKTSSGELLAMNLPDVSAILMRYGQDHHDQVAAELSHLTRATQKFVDFVMEFLPDPPEVRPPVDQVEWSKMRDYLKVIYRHRSNALHAGTPVPLPMCTPPHRFPDGTWAERPIGDGAWALGGEWTKSDLPMTLSTFEYICWSALNSWILATSAS